MGIIEKSKRSQITIFIIIAIVIVAGLISYFVIKSKISITEVPADFKSVEDYYLSCLKDAAQLGVEITETQAGWIYLPEFQPGSVENPFSSQLNFQGVGVPYWYYTTANGLVKEQVPTLSEMQRQLQRFISSQSEICNFNSFRKQGYSIQLGNATTSVRIREGSVSVDVAARLNIQLNNASTTITVHSFSYETQLGKLYKDAKILYDKEKTTMFLENYAVDVLRLYAPVDGVIIDCSPKIWNFFNVSRDLKEALEVNIATIRSGTKESYFVKDFGTSNDVNFVFFKTWPSRVEVWPAQGGLMIAQPVGLQSGMAALGFCYVPYHFVYDVYFPVLMQVGDGIETFQFPVSVIIDKSVPRNSLASDVELTSQSEICNKANTPIQVWTYDADSNPIEARISLSCLDETCILGSTKNRDNSSSLSAMAPQCANAVISAENEDYLPNDQIVSTTTSQDVYILMDKKYTKNVKVLLNGKETGDSVVVNFVSDRYSTTLIWPDQKTIKLAPGQYNITAYSYKNSSITLPESKQRQCTQVARQGILGIFGSTREKCYDIVTPGQTVDTVVSGGGKISQYITEYELKGGDLNIGLESIPTPKTIEELAAGYEILEGKILDVEFE